MYQSVSNSCLLDGCLGCFQCCISLQTVLHDYLVLYLSYLILDQRTYPFAVLLGIAKFLSHHLCMVCRFSRHFSVIDFQINSVRAREHILYDFSSLKVTVAYVMEQYMSICSVYMGEYSCAPKKNVYSVFVACSVL